MNKKELKQIQADIKDLLLFDSAWKNRKKYKSFSAETIRRIGIYRELVQGSIEDVISSMYPLTKTLLEKKWHKLISEYIEKHPPTSPILIQLAADFPIFLGEQKTILKKYPYIKELASYEWIELEVHDYKEEKKKSTKSTKLNPAHVICDFKFPITKVASLLKNDQTPKSIKSMPNSIIVYRDTKTLETRFFELSPPTRAYISLLKEGYDKNTITNTLMEAFNIDLSNKSKFKKDIVALHKKLKSNNIVL